ncbi:MAG: LysM peptidoglycan-binding domain-containing protein [Lachnospiraceae bacterium]|nr:LysM peptidoglycan-binding domain-containing protein [Lachnospiraceae bacterium]
MGANSLKKGKIIICDEKGKESDSISFTFNPSSYRISSTPHYKDIRHLASDEQKKEFIGGVERTLSATLIFDSFSDRDLFSESEAKGVSNITEGIENKLRPITDKINRLEKAVHLAGDIHSTPMVIFTWGNLKFRGIIIGFSIEYTMFSMEGKPIRAKADLQIAETRDPSVSSKTSPFESPDRTKSRVVVEGMSLWSIAWDEYDDCEKWRVIAKANNIMNPMDIYPGQVIRIPAISRE